MFAWSKKLSSMLTVTSSPCAHAMGAKTDTNNIENTASHNNLFMPDLLLTFPVSPLLAASRRCVDRVPRPTRFPSTPDLSLPSGEPGQRFRGLKFRQEATRATIPQTG